MVKLGDLPEFAKPHVGKPIITSLGNISPDVLSELQYALTSTASVAVSADSISGLGQLVTGGVSTQTLNGVATVSIPHSLAAVPRGFTAQPANVNSAALGAFYLTATDTNLVLTFGSSLTANSYSWVWTAIL